MHRFIVFGLIISGVWGAGVAHGADPKQCQETVELPLVQVEETTAEPNARALMGIWTLHGAISQIWSFLQLAEYQYVLSSEHQAILGLDEDDNKVGFAELYERLHYKLRWLEENYLRVASEEGSWIPLRQVQFEITPTRNQRGKQLSNLEKEAWNVYKNALVALRGGLDRKFQEVLMEIFGQQYDPLIELVASIDVLDRDETCLCILVDIEELLAKRLISMEDDFYFTTMSYHLTAPGAFNISERFKEVSERIITALDEDIPSDISVLVKQLPKGLNALDLNRDYILGDESFPRSYNPDQIGDTPRDYYDEDALLELQHKELEAELEAMEKAEEDKQQKQLAQQNARARAIEKKVQQAVASLWKKYIRAHEDAVAPLAVWKIFKNEVKAFTVIVDAVKADAQEVQADWASLEQGYISQIQQQYKDISEQLRSASEVEQVKVAQISIPAFPKELEQLFRQAESLSEILAGFRVPLENNSQNDATEQAGVKKAFIDGPEVLVAPGLDPIKTKDFVGFYQKLAQTHGELVAQGLQSQTALQEANLVAIEMGKLLADQKVNAELAHLMGGINELEAAITVETELLALHIADLEEYQVLGEEIAALMDVWVPVSTPTNTAITESLLTEMIVSAQQFGKVVLVDAQALLLTAIEGGLAFLTQTTFGAILGIGTVIWFAPDMWNLLTKTLNVLLPDDDENKDDDSEQNDGDSDAEDGDNDSDQDDDECLIQNIVDLSDYAKKANQGSQGAKECIVSFLDSVEDSSRLAKTWAKEGDLLASYARWESLLRAYKIGSLEHFLTKYMDARYDIFWLDKSPDACERYWYRRDCVNGKLLPSADEEWISEQRPHALEIINYGEHPNSGGAASFPSTKDEDYGVLLDLTFQKTDAPKTMHKDSYYMMNLGAGQAYENPYLMSAMHFYGKEKRVYVQNFDRAYKPEGSRPVGGEYLFPPSDLNTIGYSSAHDYQNLFLQLDTQFLFDRIDHINDESVDEAYKQSLEEVSPVQDAIVMRNPLFGGPMFGPTVDIAHSYAGAYQHLKNDEGIFYVAVDWNHKTEHRVSSWIMTEILRLDIDSSSSQHIIGWKGKPKQKESIVRLHRGGEDDPKNNFCTGFFVDPEFLPQLQQDPDYRYIATNMHCIFQSAIGTPSPRDSYRIMATTESGQTFLVDALAAYGYDDGSVVYGTPESQVNHASISQKDMPDLAILWVWGSDEPGDDESFENIKPLKLRSPDLPIKVDQYLDVYRWNVGKTASNWNKVNKHTYQVSQMDTVATPGPDMILDGTVLSGNSGSLVMDEYGSVAGIVTKSVSYNDTDNITETIAVRPSAFRKLRPIAFFEGHHYRGIKSFNADMHQNLSGAPNSPKFLFHANLQEGWKAEQSELWGLAKANYKFAMQKEPQSTTAKFNYARMLLFEEGNEDYKNGQKQLDQLLNLSEDPLVYYFKGMAYRNEYFQSNQNQDLKQRAIENFTKALNLRANARMFNRKFPAASNQLKELQQ
ncbi:MAG: hypothetical protein KDK51_07425 [Deltaproteobacteria bacterium]|nr:hypothetical protein [Deltaproteobacteria bacterium]